MSIEWRTQIVLTEYLCIIDVIKDASLKKEKDASKEM
jgi:hypothetical protein